MGRGGKKAPAPSKPRPRPKRKKGNRFGWIALILALPVAALFVFWLSGALRSFHLSTRPDQASLIETKASIDGLLVRSGIEASRITHHGEHVSIETVGDANRVAARLKKIAPELRVSVAGNQITLSDDSHRNIIDVKTMKLLDSGAGLEEAESVTTPNPVAAATAAQENIVPPTQTTPPSTTQTREKTIALILDDVGFDHQPVDRAASMGLHITFAVIPHTPNGASIARRLNERGFEILCHLPMEPDDYPRQRPGDGAILTAMSDGEIRQKTVEDVASVPFARGVNNHMGSRATSDRRVMTSVLTTLRERNLFFVDSRTSANSVAAPLARQMHVKTVARNVFLDHTEEKESIRKQLATLAALAERNGAAVGIGHVYPVTVSVLEEELPKLARQGFHFVPVSRLVE